MNTQRTQKLLRVLILLLFVSACSTSQVSAPDTRATVQSETIADTMARFEKEIPARMQADGIPGLAIAVVDDRKVLWMEGFGYTDWDRRTPVTPSTIFSIQSMSKSFTATAAMIAAQDGLVDLDEPITTYLPDFTVHSIFEEHPERKMTLRNLLSHTAGFPHDTSYGNNNDHPPYSFEKHIASISDTWLMFPVGTRYSYSNEGIDLAGYILQVHSGMPFIQYVQQKVLDPLRMKDSTLDVQRVRATSTRAIGHVELPIRPPVDFLLIPSGGVWTSAEDLARYLQFHINEGALDGQQLLQADLAETMYTPPNLSAEQAYGDSGYALGLVEGTRNGARILYHGGGGFGFANQMAWYPELKLGALVLTNAVDNSGYSFELCHNVLDSIIAGSIPLYRQRYVSATHVTPAYPPVTQGTVLTDDALRNLIASKALEQNAEAESVQQGYVGTYVVSNAGFPGDTFTISDMNGNLAWSYSANEEMFAPISTLTEVASGVLLSEGGNTFDLSGATPRVDNIALVRTHPETLPFKIALYSLCGLAFLSALFIWPVRALIGRIRKNGAVALASAAQRNPWLVAAGSLAALASLLSLFCLALIALVPNMVYFSWPRPFADLTWWQFGLVGMPFISLALAGGLALIAWLALRGRSARWYFFAVAVALLLFNAAILF